VQTTAVGALQPRLLDLSAAAAYLGLSSWTIRDLIDRGALTRVRVPLPGGRELKRVLLDVRDLDKLIDQAKDEAREGAGR
jgi:hypothetical protein